MIESMENASDAFDRDPTTCVFDAFYNTCDVASCEASNRDQTAMT